MRTEAKWKCTPRNIKTISCPVQDYSTCVNWVSATSDDIEGNRGEKEYSVVLECSKREVFRCDLETRVV